MKGKSQGDNASLQWLMEKMIGQSPKALRKRDPSELPVQNTDNRKAYAKKEKAKTLRENGIQEPFLKILLHE